MGELFAGRFELVEPLAEGGMGSVWVVRDRKDGLVYAGKMLRQSDSGSLMRFMREQATRISHDHIVTPLSWAGEDDRVLFTMPLVRGGSVATLIGDHGMLPQSWVAELIDQVLQALDAVHAAGIVHRDVKPANLLLRATGTGPPHLLLTDFGISAHLLDPRLTRASQVIGTPGYMAPEQISGADPHPTQDVYAVGMVGLEMLTGIRPSRSIDGPVASVEPSPLSALLLRAASADPRERPQSAGEFRDSVAALDIEEPVGDPEGVFVFDHVVAAVAAGEPTRVSRRRTDHALPVGGAPGAPVTSGDRNSGRRDRLIAVLLILVAGVCLAAAAWLLLS